MYVCIFTYSTHKYKGKIGLTIGIVSQLTVSGKYLKENNISKKSFNTANKGLSVLSHHQS